MTDLEKIWDLPEPPQAPEDMPADIQEDTPLTENQKAYLTEYANYEHALTKLTWYLNSYLPNTVGLQFWGPNIRPFCLMTDTKVVEGDPSGKKKVLVTKTSEAFAHLLWANSRDKWLADFILKAANKKAKIPKYNKDNPSTHKHQNKWSNSRTGQIQGGGWNKEALIFFNESIDKISEWREAQEQLGYPCYRMGRELIKAAEGVALEASDRNGSKKRKNPSGDTPETESDDIPITFLDE